MATEHNECMNCGKELTQLQIWRGGKYCSHRCFADGRWGEPISFGKILTRSKAFIEAVKLCQTGLSQVEVAKLLGLCPAWYPIGLYSTAQTQYCKTVSVHIAVSRLTGCIIEATASIAGKAALQKRSMREIIRIAGG